MFESSPSLINACFIGKTIALFIKISGNFQRASRVAVTPPSTEFSIGTTAASQLLNAIDLITECNPLPVSYTHLTLPTSTTV